MSALHYGEEFETWTTRAKSNSLSNSVMSRLRFARLYLRTRFGGYAVLGLAASAFLGWLGAQFLQMPAYKIPGNVIDEILTVVALLVPLLAASAIGVSARSPFGEEEETVSRPMPIVRVCHLGGLFVCGCILLFLGSLAWDLEHAGWVLARNLAGLTGLALLTSKVAGGGLSWLGPFSYVALTVTVNILSDDPPTGDWVNWAYWALQPAAQVSSLVVAVALLILGISSASQRSIRL